MEEKKTVSKFKTHLKKHKGKYITGGVGYCVVRKTHVIMKG